MLFACVCSVQTWQHVWGYCSIGNDIELTKSLLLLFGRANDEPEQASLKSLGTVVGMHCMVVPTGPE